RGRPCFPRVPPSFCGGTREQHHAGLSERLSGEGGIRTLEAGIPPPNALAGRRLQPLGHFSERGTGYRNNFRHHFRVRERLPCSAGRAAPWRGGGAAECAGPEIPLGGCSRTGVQNAPPPT